MKKIRTNFMMIAAATAGVVSLGSVAVASADAPSTTTTATTKIARNVVHQDRSTAVADVLGVSPATVKADIKAKTLKQAITAKGLTKKSFHLAVKAEMTRELQAQGYSAAQIAKAEMQHRGHHDKKA